MDPSRMLSSRMSLIDVSGIRRVFELARTLEDPINLSIGQPDFPVPAAIKSAAIGAIEADHNGYTLTQGIEELRGRIAERLRRDVGWDAEDPQVETLVTSGTSGALVLAAQALLDEGDEIIIPDPYFVIYPHLATMFGGRAVTCDTYPDFVLTAERVEPLITSRTKAVLFCSPSNPAGVVASRRQCEELLELCRDRGVLLISDEIYDEFTFGESRTDRFADGSRECCASPARLEGAGEAVLLVRGFGKTYGVTGWRMGWCAGPAWLVGQLRKLQQYTFVCPPSIAQWGCMAAFDVDIGLHVAEYEKRRDLVVERLGGVTELATPGGAFYAFVRVPERLGLSGTQFAERAVERNVLVIPGGVFSSRDTHFRLSFAADRAKLEAGLDVLVELMRGSE